MDYGDKKNLFFQGKLSDAYNFLGCMYERDGGSAVFRVWAPFVQRVAVAGDFNAWNADNAVMQCDDGIWHIKINGVKEFDLYKYVITTNDGRVLFKVDPYGFHSEAHAKAASKVYALNFSWNDEVWMKNRSCGFDRPVNIYEVHIGSWRRYGDGNMFSYTKFADELCAYVKEMGYTHVELMGVAEYPFDGSWGYQVTGYYAPTCRYGTPKDFAGLINKLHMAGIGVIMDWVPGHFPKDECGLYEFNGKPLYEPWDELRREHKEWGTCCFDYGRGEVKSFLISNAMYWLKEYHIDGLRVDAVASMLYNDYGRREWRPNKYGGKENLEAIDFMRALNETVFAAFPSAMMIAEESTAFPLVTYPVSDGGLGFNYKWNMGWMNDTLDYAKTDPYFKQFNHSKLTFSMMYAFSENFILPISHDEVVHGKGSLLNKMPGDYDMKFAGLRAYLMFMFAHPGKKLTFMGVDIAQFDEWNYAKELCWDLLKYPSHNTTHEFVKMLNISYRDIKAFWQQDKSWDGFEWLVVDDNCQNVIAFTRKDKAGGSVNVVINFSPCNYDNYRIGIDKGEYKPVLVSTMNGFETGGKSYKTENIPSHNKKHSINMNIQPLHAIYMVSVPKKTADISIKAKSKKVKG